jgi:hypothetical protein
MISPAPQSLHADRPAASSPRSSSPSVLNSNRPVTFSFASGNFSFSATSRLKNSFAPSASWVRIALL